MKNKSKKTNINKSEKKDIIKIDLNYFMQNQIKALILYYYFIEDIRNKYILSNGKQSIQKICGKCYLIDEKWMNLHKNIFDYQELKKQIKNIIDVDSFETAKQNLDKILTKLDKNYINALKSKEKDNPDERLDNIVKDTSNYLEIVNGKINIKKPEKYNIINQEIYEFMNKLSPKGINLLKDLKQNEYIINDGKFIIKYELHKRYELLIANYNLEDDKLIPELLFKYESKESMSYHYEQLKKFSYKIFKVNHLSGDEMKLTLNNKDESNNKMVGRIFDLNNNNLKEKENEQKEKKEKTNVNRHDINQIKNSPYHFIFTFILIV